MEPQSEPDTTISSGCAKQSCCCPCACVPKSVIDLVMWRDVKKTAPVFVGGFVLLYMLMELSLISVVAYSGLFILACAGIAKVLHKVKPQWTECCPFTSCVLGGCETKCEVTREKAERFVDVALPHANCVIARSHEVLALNNPTEVVKFTLLFWILTYIGGWFNLLTLITILFVVAFTAPRFYEQFQPQFDNVGALVKVQMDRLCKIAHEKIDLAKRKVKDVSAKKAQ